MTALLQGYFRACALRGRLLRFDPGLRSPRDFKAPTSHPPIAARHVAELGRHYWTCQPAVSLSRCYCSPRPPCPKVRTGRTRFKLDGYRVLGHQVRRGVATVAQ